MTTIATVTPVNAPATTREPTLGGVEGVTEKIAMDPANSVTGAATAQNVDTLFAKTHAVPATRPAAIARMTVYLPLRCLLGTLRTAVRSSRGPRPSVPANLPGPK